MTCIVQFAPSDYVRCSFFLFAPFLLGPLANVHASDVVSGQPDVVVYGATPAGIAAAADCRGREPKRLAGRAYMGMWGRGEEGERGHGTESKRRGRGDMAPKATWSNRSKK